MSALPGASTEVVPTLVSTVPTNIVSINRALFRTETPEAGVIVDQLGAEVRAHHSAIRRFEGKDEVPFSKKFTKEELQSLITSDSDLANRLKLGLEFIMGVTGDLNFEILSPGASLNSGTLTELGRLRKQTFVDDKHWDIPLIGDGLDISVQDLHSYHLIIRDAEGNILAGMRLAISQVPPSDFNIPQNLSYLDKVSYLRNLGFLASEALDKSGEDLEAEVTTQLREMEAVINSDAFKSFPEIVQTSIKESCAILKNLAGKNLNQLAENKSSIRELAQIDTDGSFTRAALKGSITSVERFFVTNVNSLGEKYASIRGDYLTGVMGPLLQCLLASFSINSNMPLTIIQSDRKFTNTLLRGFGSDVPEDSPMKKELDTFPKIKPGGAVRLVSKVTQMKHETSKIDPTIDKIQRDECFTLTLNFCHALTVATNEHSPMADLTKAFVSELRAANPNVINYKEIEN